jgi:regulator of protease activity HflC (stomatin/prohibitin superfamily)
MEKYIWWILVFVAWVLLRIFTKVKSIWWILGGIGLAAAALLIYFFQASWFLSLLSFGWASWLLFLIPLLFLLGLIILAGVLIYKGFYQIPNGERWAIEFFGKFHGIYGPGPVFLFPVVMKAKEAVPISEMRYRLYNPDTKHSITADFKDGTATPLGAFAFVQVIGGKAAIEKQSRNVKLTEEENTKLKENVFKVVYAGESAKKQAVNLIENATRSYLNSLTIEEGITLGRAGYDLLKSMEDPDPKNEKAKNSLSSLKQNLEEYGLQLNKVTIADFDLAKETIAARASILTMKKEAEGAEAEAKTIANSTTMAKLQMVATATGQDIKVIQEKLNKSPRLRKAFLQNSDEMIKMAMGYKAKSRFDIGVEGADGDVKELINVGAALIAAYKKIPDSESKKPREDKTGDQGKDKKKDQGRGKTGDQGKDQAKESREEKTDEEEDEE